MNKMQVDYLMHLVTTQREVTLVRYESGMDENAVEVYYYDNGGNLHGIKMMPDGKYTTQEI